MFKMSDVAKRRILVATILMSVTGAVAIAQEPAGGERYWPSWRGPLNRCLERDDERPLEGRVAGIRVGHARRMG